MKQTKLLTILGILSLLSIPAAAQPTGKGLIRGSSTAIQTFTGVGGKGAVSAGATTTIGHTVKEAITTANVYTQTRYVYVGPGSILPPVGDAPSNAVVSPTVNLPKNLLSRFTSPEDLSFLAQAQKETAYRLILKHKYNNRLPAELQGTLTRTVQGLYQSPEALIDYLMQHNVSADALLADVATKYTTQSFLDKTISPLYFNAINEQLLTLLLTKYKADPNTLYKDPTSDKIEEPLFFQFIEGAMDAISPAKARANQIAFQLCYDNGANLSLQGRNGNTGWYSLVTTWPSAKYTKYLKDLKNPDILNTNMNTLLHALAALPNTTWSEMQTLIDLGVDPTRRNKEGKTAADVVYSSALVHGSSVYNFELRQRLLTAETVWRYNHPGK